MRRILVAAALAALAGGAAAGPSDTCTTLHNAYDDEMNDLAKLEARPDFVEWPKSESRFINVALHPFVIWKSAMHHGYNDAIPAQARKVSALLACGRERGCDWAGKPGMDVSMGGTMLPKEQCDIW